MDFGWDIHFFLIITSPRRESKSDGSESLKSFQRASIFSTSSLDCNNTDFCWIRGLFESEKSLFCWCKSLQSRGDSSRKLSPFFVETASHHKGAIVIYFSSHHKNGENVSEIMMMMVKMMVEMIMQLGGPNQIMRCFLIALTSSTVDILRLLLHFLTRANCFRKICEIEPWLLTPAPPNQRGVGSWCQKMVRLIANLCLFSIF